MSRSASGALALAAGLLLSPLVATASPGPQPAPLPPPIPAPVDEAYPGVLVVAIDASDVRHHVYHVHETIPVAAGQGELIALYPQWRPGGHAPEGPIDRIAGIRFSAGGQPLAWTRDTVNVFAFHVPLPAGAGSVDVDFDYLSPVNGQAGALEISQSIARIEPFTTVIYPAGYYIRDIPVDTAITIPRGWSISTALEAEGPTSADGVTRYKRSSLNTVFDSPAYAGRYRRVLSLGSTGGAPVNLDMFAEDPDDLALTPEQEKLHRQLIEQGQKLYGSHHYDHYDFLLSLSNVVSGMGLEHHQSSEDGHPEKYFTEWAKGVAGRDLLAHEYTHSWNGKFRRGADLWTPNLNVPMRDSLLWVYEGQTQYWGEILTSRSGQWNREQALDIIAGNAARYGEGMPGRQWRALADTTNDEILNNRRPQSWNSWQRFEDYYSEGALIWLDADTLIRERSKGKRSLDDFARGFFGVDSGSYITRTYTFDDVVAALNKVEPYDWASFLHARVDRIGAPVPLDGIARGGYRLVFTDKPGEVWTSGEARGKGLNLSYSIGAALGGAGEVRGVIWGSPAFKAGLAGGMQILAVDGTVYDGDVLKSAIKHAAADPNRPIVLTVKDQDVVRQVNLDWHGGLRYPHLEKVGTGHASLDDILAAKK